MKFLVEERRLHSSVWSWRFIKSVFEIVYAVAIFRYHSTRSGARNHGPLFVLDHVLRGCLRGRQIR
jgi:hypothetical protein